MSKKIFKKRMWGFIAFNTGLFLCLYSFESRTDKGPFRGVNVGVKAGVSQHDDKMSSLTSVGGPLQDTVNVSGHTPVFGMQFEVECPILSTLYLGTILGADVGLNHAQSRINTTIPATYYQASLKHKIELSLKFGRPYADVFPFLKLGAVFGQWQIKSRSIGGHNNKKQYRLGLLAGAGIDFKLNDDWTWGGLVEYERYKAIKGQYLPANGAASFSDWVARPALTTASIHFKKKIL
jgi:opacity protein-like surface antigen